MDVDVDHLFAWEGVSEEPTGVRPGATSDRRNGATITLKETAHLQRFL
jgi:hypothetical protein